MSRLFRAVFAQECTDWHHKLALDALRHLRCESASRWVNLFLRHFDAYLLGAQDPDRRFRDYRNHVLHVDEGPWGGAPNAACEWYEKAVAELRARRWRKAVYAAGVLSHYYTDPLQPLHTARDEAQGAVSRALEWSLLRGYGELQNILEEDFGGYPDFDVPAGEDWLRQMMLDGARHARRHHETLLDHYRLERAVRRPENGLDQELKDCLAELIGRAAVGFSRVLEQAFEQSGVDPPRVGVGWLGCLATLSAPIAWSTRCFHDVRQRSAVRGAYRELRRSGRVEKCLPADEREVRRLHAEEVRRCSLEQLREEPPRETGRRHGEGAEPRARSRRPVSKFVRPLSRIEGTHAAESAEPPLPRQTRFYLEPDSDIAEAPSIASKTARRLRKVGIATVSDLLSADCDELAERIGAGSIDSRTLADWRDQARLVCRIPHLREQDARILVGCDFREPEDLAGVEPEEILPLVVDFMESPGGERLGRDMSRRLDLNEVRRWVQWAGQARSLSLPTGDASSNAA